MEVPESLYFTEEHEWARRDDERLVIGISHYAQDVLGDIVYVELPAEGEDVEAGDEFGLVESVKAASSVYAPVSGTIVAVNDELADSPELVNSSPYDEGWMIEVEAADIDELEELMDASAYKSFLE
jgi:glycine cleavage system H protein